MKAVSIFLLVVLALSSCAGNLFSRFYVDESEVSMVTIRQDYDDLPLELSREQALALIQELNGSFSAGAVKYLTRYIVEISLPNDSILSLSCGSDKAFSENSLDSYNAPRDDFFNLYWDSIHGDSIAWRLFTPVDNVSQRLIVSHNPKFTKQESENIAKVLSYNNIQNKIVGDRVYYRNEVFETEFFWNLTTKSRDARWLNEH